MSDSSHPRRPHSTKDAKPEPSAGQVLEFPSEPAPTGTWTDEKAEPAESTHDRPVGQLVVFPRQPVTGTRPAARREPSGQHATKQEPAVLPAAGETPERPPFLASELLRQNWTPAHPLARSARVVGAVAAAAGIAAVLVAGPLSAWTAVVALGVALIATALPLKASLRGWVLVAAAGSGLALALLASIAALGPLLGALAAGALFFRGSHRASRVAKSLVGFTTAAGLSWWALDGGLGSLQIEAIEPGDVLGACVHGALLVLIVTSTLSFVDPLGTGGAFGFGLAWLVLVVAHAAATAIGTSETLGPLLAAPALAILLAFALPQALASVTPRAAHSRG